MDGAGFKWRLWEPFLRIAYEINKEVAYSLDRVFRWYFCDHIINLISDNVRRFNISNTE